MFEKFLSLFERLVFALEKLAAINPDAGSDVQIAAQNAETKAPTKKRAAAGTKAEPAAGTAASEPAPSANTASTEKKVESVTKDQVRALMQQLGEFITVAGVLAITKTFATTNTDPKDRPYTGESIGTIDPLKYNEVAEALGKRISEEAAKKAKPAESNPLDD